MGRLLMLIGIGAAAYTMRDGRNRKKMMSWMKNVDIQDLMPKKATMRRMNKMIKNFG